MIDLSSNMSTMAKYRWNLRGYLEKNNLKPSEVANELGSVSRAPTVYRLSSPRSKELSKVSLETLNDLIDVLEGLTGKEVTPNDLITELDKVSASA